ncbi:hypothetical protein [Bacillus pseudomycoides]|uniref:hypothetical protein n=1 Tax=Bacillus pseudomycoides TaxID=64104 RepID=UPI000BFCFA51|nr:hypothetical protein [Bacillus pseudomycoides]PHA67322.1 hypothetical protein COE76_01045 [Bacillus pseudomycoides]
MANTVRKDIRTVVEKFIKTCIDKGVSIDTAFELVEKLAVLIPQKRHDEWMVLANQAIEDAQNKEGAML